MSRYDQFCRAPALTLKPFERCRIWMWGNMKIGKSTLMAGRPNTAYIDPDDGGWSIPLGPGSERFPILDPGTLEDFVAFLCEEKQAGKCPFNHVLMDPVDSLIPIIEDMLTIEKKTDILMWGGGKGGYNLIAKRFQSMLRRLYAVGFGWTVVGHRHMRTITLEDGSEVEKMAPTVYPSINRRLRGDCDFAVEFRTESEGHLNEDNVLEHVRHRFLLWETPARVSTDDATLTGRVSMPERLDLPTTWADREGFLLMEETYNQGLEERRELLGL
jgi:hypothetical protein